MNEKTNNIFYPTKSICQYLWTKPSQVSRQKLQLKLWLIISSVHYGHFVTGYGFVPGMDPYPVGMNSYPVGTNPYPVGMDPYPVSFINL